MVSLENRIVAGAEPRANDHQAKGNKICISRNITEDDK
jgi:hypothetical protein